MTTRHRLFSLVAVTIALHLGSMAVSAAEPLQSVPSKLTGIVLLPNGEPAADAPVILFWRSLYGETRTDAAGNFSFSVDAGAINAAVGDHWARLAVAAALPDHGPGWTTLGELKEGEAVTLRLVEDQPIQGHILDQQGRPVVGATITVENMHRSKDENLDEFMRASRDEPTRIWMHERTSMLYLSPEALLTLRGTTDQKRPTAKTDKNGAFKLAGFGKERSLTVLLDGPQIARDEFYIVTRRKIDARWKRGQPSRETLAEIQSGADLPSVYPAEFHHLASPGSSVRGRLTDKETGKPVAGMSILANMRGAGTTASAKSDEEGRFQISGLPLEGKLRLSVLNPGDQPYLDARLIYDVSATRPLEPLALSLDRGVRVVGRVSSRKPGDGRVQGNVGYLTWRNNAALKDLSHPYDTYNTMSPDGEGRFSIVVPPGPGILTFTARNRNQFDRAKPDDFGFPVRRSGFYTMFGSGNRGLVRAQDFHYLKRIEPKVGQTELPIDIVLGRGPTIPVKVITAAGTIAGQLEAQGLYPGSNAMLRLGKFELIGLRPGESRTFFLRDEKKECAGLFELALPETASDANPEPEVTITLESASTISGRLTDAKGSPLKQWLVAAATIGTSEALNTASTTENSAKTPKPRFTFSFTKTDADGFFHLKGIPAAVDIEILGSPDDSIRRPQSKVIQTLSLRPDQKLDLGQIKLK